MTEATKKLAERLHDVVVTISDGWLVRPVTEPSGLLSEFAVQIENGTLLRVGVLQLVSETPGPRPKLTSSSVGAITNMVRGGLHAEDLATGIPTLPLGVTVHTFEVVDGQPQFRLELSESGEEYTVSVKKTRHRPSVGDPIPEGSMWQVQWSPGRAKPGDPRLVSYYTATNHSEACRLWATDSSRNDTDLLHNASLFSSPIVEPEPEPADPSTCENCGGETFHHTVECFLGQQESSPVVHLSEKDRDLLAQIAANTTPIKFTLLPKIGDVVETNVGQPVETKPAPGAEPMEQIEAGYDEVLDRIHFGSQSYERMLTSDEVTELRHKIGLYVSDARASFSGTAVPDAVDRIMGALQR